MVNTSELGGYTNNLSNKEGIKKLLKEVDNLFLTKVDIASALPTGKETTDTVTFQDLIDIGIIVIPPEPEPETEN